MKNSENDSNTLVYGTNIPYPLDKVLIYIYLPNGQFTAISNSKELKNLYCDQAFHRADIIHDITIRNNKEFILRNDCSLQNNIFQTTISENLEKDSLNQLVDQFKGGQTKTQESKNAYGEQYIQIKPSMTFNLKKESLPKEFLFFIAIM